MNMRSSLSLHIRRLHDALFRSSGYIRKYHARCDVSRSRLKRENGPISSYTRLISDDISNIVTPGYGATLGISQDDDGEIYCRGGVSHNVVNINNDHVSRALENYTTFLSDNAEAVAKIKDLVISESTNIHSSKVATATRVDYEVFGQYAYFADTGWPDDNPMCKLKGYESNSRDISEQPFLVRTKLPSSRRLNPRSRGSCHSTVDDNLLSGNRQRIFNFGSIKSACSDDTNDVVSLRIFPYRKSCSLIAIIQRDGSNGTSARFVAVRANVKGNSRSDMAESTTNGIGKMTKASLSEVGELHFMPRGTRRDDHLVPIFYTVVNKRERAWQLRRAYIHIGKGMITNDRPVYTEHDPTRFISLYKSKDGIILYMAIVSHGKTVSVFCIKRAKQLKLYHVPLPTAKKVLLEHRSPSIYAVYNEEESKEENNNGKAMQLYRMLCHLSKSKRGTDGDFEHMNVHSIICKMNDRLLKPVYARRKKGTSRHRNTTTYRNNTAYQWMTVSRMANTIVSDMDMLKRGMVMYSYTPPSSPKILVMAFGNKRKRGKPLHKPRFHEVLYEVTLPLEVGVLEPQPNANFGATNVKVVLNAPGSNNGLCEIDLDKVSSIAVEDDVDSTVLEPITTQPLSESRASMSPESLLYSDIKKMDDDDDDALIRCDIDLLRTHVCVCYVNSRDGSCKIPVTLVRSAADHHVGAESPSTCGGGIDAFKGGGSHKCIVYAYGAYGERLQVGNDVEHNVLLKLGYTLCFAHVRGGGELGDEWHSGGSKMQKHKGIFDLIDVMEFLLAKDISQRNKLAVVTTSAGGVLAGALYNMRPDLCSCIMLKLPFLDVFNTLLDPSQPLIQLEHEEFGYPEDSNLDYVYSYSPCNNGLRMGYAKPSLIIQCNDEDARAPWQQSAAFVSLHARQVRRIFMKISQGAHMDGNSYEECMKLIAERIALIDHQLL